MRFSYIILFELEILYLMLDLLNSISFNQEILPRKQKQKQDLKITLSVAGSLCCLDGLRINPIADSREPFGFW